MVNGVIWPKLTVERRRYRFRVLNGSNARAYCLKAVTIDHNNKVKDEIPLDRFVRQVGSDGGLLAAPVTVPTGGLLIGSAERVDLIVDFGTLKDIHSRVALVNIAFAPFHVTTVQDPQGEVDPTLKGGCGDAAPPGKAGDAVPGLRLPHPFVMAFELTHAGTPDESTSMIPTTGPAPVLADLPPLTHADLPEDHGHRLVALVENPPGMLQMFELAAPTPDELGRYNQLSFTAAITIRDIDHATNQPVDTAYIPVSERFTDRVNFFVPYGRTEVWKILNLTVDTHPFHVHLVQFRVLERRAFNIDGYNAGMGGTAFGNPIQPSDSPGLPVDDNEKGWKDTVRINPGEMVSIAARFDGFSGRFMYHCHILEHEDHEMMRPFVVMPMEVMNLMGEMAMIDGMGGKSGKPMPPMGGM
jgi:FtsP/CotA-like multicopper oxidase with cupredoxin domain